MVDFSDSKAERERIIFKIFVEATQLPVVSGSIRSLPPSNRPPLNPDILCMRIGDILNFRLAAAGVGCCWEIEKGTARQLLQKRLKLAQRFRNHLNRSGSFLHRLSDFPVETFDLVRKQHAVTIGVRRDQHFEGIPFHLTRHGTTKHQPASTIVVRR